MSDPDRFWTIDAEVPNEDGTPTGRFFVTPNIVHGRTICDGLDLEPDPDPTIDTLGPYSDRVAKMIAGKKNKKEGW